MNSVQVTYDGHKQKVTALCQCGWSYTDTRTNSTEVHRQAIEHTPCSQLPSAPSPADDTASESPFYCVGAQLNWKCRTQCLGCYRAGNDAAPEPVPTEGPKVAHVVKNKSTAKGREFWAHVESVAAHVRSAAPIAPAAVSDSTILQILKDYCDRDWKDETHEQVAVIVSNAMFWRNDEIRRLRDKLAKPSAEGNGWIAPEEWVTDTGIQTLVSRYRHSPTLMAALGELQEWRKLRGKLPASPSGQGEGK